MFTGYTTYIKGAIRMSDIYDRILDEVNMALPQFNVHTLKHARQDPIKKISSTLDMVFAEAVKMYGDTVTYLGHRILTPEECIASNCENEKYNSLVDTTRTELVLTEFRASHQGEEFGIQLYIPYITEDCIIINGSKYYLMFALTDKVFYHIDKDNGIGIKVLRAHLRFRRNTRFSFVSMKGNVYGDHIVIAKIHLRKYKYVSEDIKTALLLYPLVRYGFKGTLEKYGINPDHVEVTNYANLDDPDFDYFCVKPNDEIVNTETGEVTIKPGLFLKVHNDVLRSQYDKEKRLHIRVVTAIRYIMNYFVQCKDTIYTDNEQILRFMMHDPTNIIYQVILGKSVYGINYENELQVAGHARSHLSSLKSYLDPQTKLKLKAINVHCNDIYDLIHYIDVHVDEFVANFYPSNIYNKQLNILDLLLGNMTRNMFNKVYHQTNNRKGGRPFTTKEIANSFKIGSKALAKIYKCNGVIASNPSQYNDCWLLTVGGRKKRATFATTSDAPGAKSKKKSGGDINLIHDPTHRLHSSMLYVESLSRTPHTDPTIGGTINPFCPFNDNGEILKAPWIEEVLPLDQYVHTR